LERLWVKANQNSGSRIILKIGAKDNLGSLDTNLSKSSILAAFSEGKEKFGDNLKCISIHWDNRGKDELRYIHESLSALKNINDMGVVIGLSGILNPKLYQGKVSDFKGNLKIQVKENISTRAARIKYAKYFPHAEYCSYGANMGGIKKNNQEKGSSVALRGISTSAKLLNKIDKFIDVEIPKGIHIRNYNDLAMYFSSINPHLWGTIIGPRNKEQLIDTLSIWKAVRSYNNLVEPKLMYSKFIDYFEPAS
jgi:hypothetical protein